MRARRHLPWCLVALMACEGLTPPDRDLAYPTTSIGLNYHWPQDRLPIRFWVAPGSGDLASYVESGLGVWRNQLLYEEFRGVLVADSAAADVLVRVTPRNPPSLPRSPTPPPRGICGGVTDFFTTVEYSAGGADSTIRFAGPFQVLVTWRPSDPDQTVVDCLYRVVVHEIGHTLGIFSHSPDSMDVMHANPLVLAPSVADRATIQRVYHTPADIAPPALERLRP